MSQAYFTKFRAKPGKGDELYSFLKDVANYMKTYAGCNEYRVFKVIGEDDIVGVFESWIDSNAHSKSLEDSHVREMITKGMQLIDKVISQEKLSE